MILISAIVPIIALYLALLYIVFIYRFFRVKAKLSVLEVRDGMDRLNKRRIRVAVLAVLVFSVCLAARLAVKSWAPDMLMAFNYEEAAKGHGK